MSRIEPLFVYNKNTCLENNQKSFQNSTNTSAAVIPAVTAKYSSANLYANYCTQPSFGHLATYHLRHGGAYVEKATKNVFFNLFTHKDVKEVFLVIKKAASEKETYFKMSKNDKNIFRTILRSKDAKDGDNYAFKIVKENGESFLAPDPRAQRKIDFKSPFSQIYDQNKYKWHDQNWTNGKNPAKLSQVPNSGLLPLSENKILEINIPAFTEEGTFDSAIKEIDKLIKRGFFKPDGSGTWNSIEIMPLESAYAPGWSYDGIFKGAVMEPLGGPEGLKKLIDHMHSKNINAIIDAVPNHFGCDGNPLGKIGPYFNKNPKDHDFGEKFNLENDHENNAQVRDFLTDVCGLNWLRDYHFDGIRLDLTHAMESDNALKEMTEEMNHHYPNAFVIVEDNRKEMTDRLCKAIPAQKTPEEHVNSIKQYATNKNSLKEIGPNGRWGYELEHVMNRFVKGDASVSELFNTIIDSIKRGDIIYGIRESHDEIGSINAIKAVSDLVCKKLNMFNRVAGIDDKERGVRASQSIQETLTKIVSGEYSNETIKEIIEKYHVVNMPDIHEIATALISSISKNKVSQGIISTIPKVGKMRFMGSLADITPFRFFRIFSENAEADYKMLEAQKGYRAGKEALEESKLSAIHYTKGYKQVIDAVDQYEIDLNEIVQKSPALKSGDVVGGVTHDGSGVMGMHMKNGENEAFTVSNISDFSYDKNYKIQFPQGKWKVSICSDSTKYAGSGKNLQLTNVISDGRNVSEISIPANSFTVFQKIS